MGGAPSAYLAELSNPSIDPQRVGRDAGNSVAWLAQLPQGGSTRRRGRVQRATTSGTTARWRFRLRALPYYARAGGRCDQNRRRRRLARATVVAALHALPGTHRWHVDYWFALDQYRGSMQHDMGWNEIRDNIVIFPVNVDLFWNFYILFLILYSLIMLHFKVDWSIIYYFSFSLPLKIIFDWDNLRIRQDFEILFFFKYIMLKSTILLKFYYNFGIFFSLLEKDYFGLGRGKGFWKRCKKEMKRLR